MKVYIAGPMSGYPNNNFDAFDAARDACVACGHEVVSPADMNRERGFDPKRVPTAEEYAEFMRDDVRAIIDADAIVLLEGWENSKGATFERKVAEMTGRKILMMENMT